MSVSGLMSRGSCAAFAHEGAADYCRTARRPLDVDEVGALGDWRYQ